MPIRNQLLTQRGAAPRGTPPEGGQYAVTLNPDTATVAPGSTVDIDVLANDTSTGGPLVLQSVSTPTIGTASVVNNKVRYAAPANATPGSMVTFSYTAAPSGGTPRVGTINVALQSALAYGPAPRKPYEGLFYGNAVMTHGPGDLEMDGAKTVVMPFQSRYDGILRAIGIHIRNNDAGSTASYSKGNGGSIVFEIHATNPTNSDQSNGTILGKTKVYTNATQTFGTGGKGIKFPLNDGGMPEPVLERGKYYAIVGKNVHSDPANNFCSVNHITNVWFQSTYSNTKPKKLSDYFYDVRAGWGNSTGGGLAPRYDRHGTYLLHIDLQDGQPEIATGPATIYAQPSGGLIDITNTKWLRQIMVVTEAIRIPGMWVVAYRYSATAAGDLVLELRNSSGTLLRSSSRATSDWANIPFVGGIPNMSFADQMLYNPGEEWKWLAFASPITLDPGTYIATFRCSAANVTMRVMLNMSGNQTSLHQGAMRTKEQFPAGSYAQQSSNSGSSWVGPTIWGTANRTDFVMPLLAPLV